MATTFHGFILTDLAVCQAKSDANCYANSLNKYYYLATLARDANHYFFTECFQYLHFRSLLTPPSWHLLFPPLPSEEWAQMRKTNVLMH